MLYFTKRGAVLDSLIQRVRGRMNSFFSMEPEQSASILRETWSGFMMFHGNMEWFQWFHVYIHILVAHMVCEKRTDDMILT